LRRRRGSPRRLRAPVGERRAHDRFVGGRHAHLEDGRVAPLRGGEVGAGVGRGGRRLAGGGRSRAASQRVHTRGERQLETLARGALGARVAEEVRVGARAGAGGGLVRASAAVTLGLACAVAGRRLLVAAGRFARRRRAPLAGGGFGAGRRLRRDRPALLGVARVRQPIG